jgi:hypothetical protein
VVPTEGGVVSSPTPDDFVENWTPRVRLAHLDLDERERCAIRRHYRDLRLAIYAPQSSEYAWNGMYQGCYGMDRDEAKVFLWDYWTTIADHVYLGTK